MTWTDHAIGQLKAIFDYISQDSKAYANNVKKLIIEKGNEADFFPQKGRIVPEIGDSNIRELFVYSYRVIYRIENRVYLHIWSDFPTGLKFFFTFFSMKFLSDKYFPYPR